MTPDEHYTRAERLLDAANDRPAAADPADVPAVTKLRALVNY